MHLMNSKLGGGFGVEVGVGGQPYRVLQRGDNNYVLPMPVLTVHILRKDHAGARPSKLAHKVKAYLVLGEALSKLLAVLRVDVDEAAQHRVTAHAHRPRAVQRLNSSDPCVRYNVQYRTGVARVGECGSNRAQEQYIVIGVSGHDKVIKGIPKGLPFVIAARQDPVSIGLKRDYFHADAAFKANGTRFGGHSYGLAYHVFALVAGYFQPRRVKLSNGELQGNKNPFHKQARYRRFLAPAHGDKAVGGKACLGRGVMIADKTKLPVGYRRGIDAA